jgi:hypothetical protein
MCHIVSTPRIAFDELSRSDPAGDRTAQNQRRWILKRHFELPGPLQSPLTTVVYAHPSDDEMAAKVRGLGCCRLFFAGTFLSLTRYVCLTGDRLPCMLD